jgi:hypothetical protein
MAESAMKSEHFCSGAMPALLKGCQFKTDLEVEKAINTNKNELNG